MKSSMIALCNSTNTFASMRESERQKLCHVAPHLQHGSESVDRPLQSTQSEVPESSKLSAVTLRQRLELSD